MGSGGAELGLLFPSCRGLYCLRNPSLFRRTCLLWAFSRLFGVMGLVSLVSLNLRVCKSPFKVETSICASVCVERRLVGLHRLEGYLLASSIHPDGRKYLSFVALKQVFNPKLFVSVSLQLHMFFHGSWLRSRSFSSPGYSHVQIPDDWFIQASSHSLVLQALETVVHLCQDLGIVITWEKSSLLPSQRVVYLGVTLDSTLFRASPSQPRARSYA